MEENVDVPSAGEEAGPSCGREALSSISDASFSPPKLVANIEFVNGEYVVYSKKVAGELQNVCRIVLEAIGTVDGMCGDAERRGPPFILMPEQVAVLLEYGYGRVVRLKNVLPVEGATKCGGEKAEGKNKKTLNEEEMRKKAILIAKGRKAKTLKRKANQGASAVALKVRKTDLEHIEVSAEEVDSVLSELSKPVELPANFEKWIIPFYDEDNDAYDVVESCKFPETPEFRIRLNVFRDLWRRGYYMTDGLKFGCDYLLYEHKPGEVHAKWMVKCVDSMFSLCPLDLAALSRVATQVSKIIILAIVSPDSVFPYYLEMSWWKS